MSELDKTLPMETSALPLVGESEVGRMHSALRTLSHLPISKQMGLMLILALSVAIGVAAVLWSQAPDYDLLFANVAEKDSA